MKTLTTTLLLTLLVLGGCSTELDRCIEYKLKKPDADAKVNFGDVRFYTNAIKRTSCTEDLATRRGETVAECNIRLEENHLSRMYMVAEDLCNEQGIY